MKIIRVYQPSLYRAGTSIELDKSSSNHLIKVLRLKNNYHFNLFNGEGTECSAILEISGKKAVAHIQEILDNTLESNLNIHLLQGISKGDRMDFAIQKSIELGVTSITPVITERTAVNLKGSRAEKKILHWKSIAISACEQSGRNYLPPINPICHFKQCVESNDYDANLLLDPLSDRHIKNLPSAKNIQILIGPEGGLSNSEIAQAKDNKFTGIGLGPRILRTETAALAAITSVQLLWGDMG